MNSASLLSIGDLSRERTEQLLDRAQEMQQTVASRGQLSVLKDRVLTTLFFQPSTRTLLSFQAAMWRLGGHVLNFTDIDRAGTGYRRVESLADIARVVDGYTDATAIRHSEAGIAHEFAAYSRAPVFNAGDGMGAGSEHPTQALVDLFTIRQAIGRLDEVTVLMIGELQSRAARSLLRAFAKFKAVTVYTFYPEKYYLTPEEHTELVSHANGPWIERVAGAKDVINEVDVVYHCGTRKDPPDYRPDDFSVTTGMIDGARDSLIILHPLPRGPTDIAPELDGRPCALYFRQAQNGLPVRMALLASTIGA